MEVEQRSNYNIEENKASTNNDFPTKLDQSIRHLIENQGYIKYKVDKRCISTNGGNYLAVLYEIDVTGKTKDGDKEIHIFVKHAINIESFQLVSISQVYRSELFLYKDLSKMFTVMQENAKIPIREMYKMVKVYDESNTDAIIMENLTKKGFTTYHRMDRLPLQFMEISVKHLAKFHALSFVLKETEPEYFNNKIKPLNHPIAENGFSGELVESTKDAVMSSVDEDFKDKLEKIYKDIGNKYVECFKDDSIKVCLCHGDYRPNNILVKTNEGEVEDIMPVDYQLIHYGSPVLDFLFLIYVGTDRDFRQINLLNLKDLYYDTFSNFLKYFDLNAEKVYSRKDFEKVYAEKHEYGLICGILGLPFIFACENHLIDMTKDKSDVSLQLDDRFKDRLRGYMEDYDEMGFV